MKVIWLRLVATRSLMIIALLFLRGNCSPAQSTILGVLEDVPPVYSGDVDKPAIRVLFRFADRRWIPYPSDCTNEDCLRAIVSKYPTNLQWSISFHGREITKLTSRSPSDFKLYSHVGLHDVEQASAVHWVGDKSEDWGGFAGAAVYRPLIATSNSYFADPDGWKEATASVEIQGALRKAFRRLNPKLCRRSQTDENTAILFHFRDDQIAITKAYQSKSGLWLARLHLEDASACDDVVEFDDPWFIVRPDKSTKYLGEGMWLVDAGDYDSDGRSELLFAIDSYNRGGYELFYDDFARHSSFEYSFH
jgi:hypothetical protein